MSELDTDFNLSTVFRAVASAVPERTVLVWRDLRLSYADMDARIDGVAHFLTAAGLGCHTDRASLHGHESGQDHLGIYLRNGNEYLESMIGAYRARVAPFNVSYRYVEDELGYLLTDSNAAALVYNAEFAPRVEAIRERLPHLKLLIQVGDESGNDLLPGAVHYDSITSTSVPPTGMPTPRGNDLYLLYTGGTTGMPKAVLWRQHDIFLSSMGGRPVHRDQPLTSYQELQDQARNTEGFSMLIIPPFMHAAAQWATFFAMTRGGLLVIPDDVNGFRPAAVLQLAQREGVISMPIVGDAIGRPLVEELETGAYELPRLVNIANAAAPLTPTVRDRILAALPHIVLSDGVGSSETGIQMMSAASSGQAGPAPSTFIPQADTAVVDDDFSRVLQPGQGEGWLARRGPIPLGYLNDEAKTARTFPTIDDTRWSIPGDRARILADGSVELLGRDSVTINSGGEKIFVEEVERAIAAHPAVYDVVVVGRPSNRWGSEVIGIVQLANNQTATDDDLAEVCRKQIAGYKIPKKFIRVDNVVRSPAGKADYRWAKDIATERRA